MGSRNRPSLSLFFLDKKRVFYPLYTRYFEQTENANLELKMYF